MPVGDDTSCRRSRPQSWFPATGQALWRQGCRLDVPKRRDQVLETRQVGDLRVEERAAGDQPPGAVPGTDTVELVVGVEVPTSETAASLADTLGSATEVTDPLMERGRHR